MTSWLEIFLVAIGGGSGAVLRWLSDEWLKRSTRPPLSLIIINVLGSTLLGVLSTTAQLSSEMLMLVGVGVLGGFTTFSSASVEAAQFARRRDWTNAWLVPSTMLALSLLGAWLGMQLGRLH